MVGAAAYRRAAAGRRRRAAPDWRLGTAGCTAGGRHPGEPRRAAGGETLPALGGAGDDMSAVQRARFADDLVRKLAAAIRSAQLYTSGHPIVVRSISALAESDRKSVV